jgi:hypothetical protein
MKRVEKQVFPRFHAPRWPLPLGAGRVELHRRASGWRPGGNEHQALLPPTATHPLIELRDHALAHVGVDGTTWSLPIPASVCESAPCGRSIPQEDRGRTVHLRPGPGIGPRHRQPPRSGHATNRPRPHGLVRLLSQPSRWGRAGIHGSTPPPGDDHDCELCSAADTREIVDYLPRSHTIVNNR